ncbi:OmpA family protein [Streptomyces roseoverticillatus]|uniref:OmpA family protein n=1 Tax=Streptomyces roseoverticillatus TaxID=66429 RepID=UPI001F1F59BD|nr:OmpA family protein [Streptomyces roseoverticillatus]MCF3105647.1 OmpA family protein [Streptomyces roseoverticillatus]
MRKLRTHSATLLASAVLAAGLTGTAVTAAAADDVPAAPSVFKGKIDPKAPGLKLEPGRTLGPPKVLDLKTIVGDESESERREDSESDVKFQLQAEVLFAKDSADLNPAANDRIKTIADEVRKQNARQVNVFGFTDNLGSHEHGMELSKQRADAVQKELSKTLGSDVRYEIRGYAEDAPIASNDSEEGRTKNRRVEVSFPRSN